MQTWILFIIMGLIWTLLPRTQWYKNDIKKHNFSDLEDFFGTIRNGVGVTFIVLGAIGLIIKLIYT